MSWPNENPYSSIGSAPWQAIADSGYVYVINYASDTLVQINKATHQVNQIQIPYGTAPPMPAGMARLVSRTSVIGSRGTKSTAHRIPRGLAAAGSQR